MNKLLLLLLPLSASVQLIDSEIIPGLAVSLSKQNLWWMSDGLQDTQPTMSKHSKNFHKGAPVCKHHKLQKQQFEEQHLQIHLHGNNKKITENPQKYDWLQNLQTELSLSLSLSLSPRFNGHFPCGPGLAGNGTRMYPFWILLVPK